MSTLQKTTSLGTFALVMLISGAIDSIRNLPATALFGSTLIFFFIFSAIVFLIPTTLVSAELSSAWTKKGGIYSWVQLAFGEKLAFLAVWLQWINTIVWFPTILSFIAGTATYFLAPNLAQNKLYLVSMILGVFWLLTFINLRGINVSVRLASFCTIVGMVVPMSLIILLAVIWVILGKPLQVSLTSSDLLPALNHSENWISLTAIMTAFLGMELATVHVKEVANAQKVFPKALLFSVLLILVTMICGSLAIAIVLPPDQINLVNGVVQAFTNFFATYHLTWLLPVISFMILIGSLGGVINWAISPAKGLLQSAQLGYLPAFLQKENKYGVASNLLIAQAILVSVICLAFLLMPTVNGSYWLLTALSTQLYMLMYVMMFAAAFYLRYKFADQERPFKIPGGLIGMGFVCLLGTSGTVITLIVGFFPPAGIDVGGVGHYELVFTSCLIGMIAPVLLFYLYNQRQRQFVTVAAEAS